MLNTCSDLNHDVLSLHNNKLHNLKNTNAMAQYEILLTYCNLSNIRKVVVDF